jgi:AcrR family transcriptional regulator
LAVLLESGTVESTNAQQRAPWGTLTRDAVIDAAARAVKSGQFGTMTIRSLAAELGVAPMSLYRHVQDKDDLVGQVVDRLLARRWRPRVDRTDWLAWTKEAVERFRDFLIAEPAALYIYLRQPVVSPAAITRMETMLEVLRSTGFDDPSARRAYASLHTYTIGFAALEASRARSVGRGDDVGDLARQLREFSTPRQFSEGLEYLLDGIGQRMGTAH